MNDPFVHKPVSGSAQDETCPQDSTAEQNNTAAQSNTTVQDTTATQNITVARNNAIRQSTSVTQSVSDSSKSTAAKFPNNRSFCGDVLNTAGSIFFAALMGFFPLFCGGSYNIILDSKYAAFETITIFSAVFFVFFCLLKNVSIRRSKPSITLTDRTKASFKSAVLTLVKTADVTVILLICFCLLTLLSAVLSPYAPALNSSGQSAVIFGSGRYDGLYVLALYGAVFALSYFFVKFDYKCVLLVGAVTLIMSIIGILQLFGINAFGLYPADIYTGYYAEFISTMGNIDFMSALMSMFLPLVFGCFLSADGSRKSEAFLLICFFVGGFCLIKTDVQSGMIALLVTAALTLPLSLKSKRSLAKALVFLQTSTVLIWLCNCFDLSKGEGTTVVQFCINAKLTIAAAVVIFLLLALLILQRKKGLSKKVLSKLPCALFIFEGAALLLLAAYMYFLFTPADKDNALNQLYALLHGSLSQSSGSGRGGIWKYSFLMGLERPVLGHGQGCYKLAMDDFSARVGYTYYTSRNASLDAAHNEFLQLFCTGGILGLLSYAGALASLIARSIKRRFSGKYTVCLLSAVVGYLVQSFFTFSIVEVAPVFFMLCGILLHNVRDAGKVSSPEKKFLQKSEQFRQESVTGKIFFDRAKKPYSENNNC